MAGCAFLFFIGEGHWANPPIPKFSPFSVPFVVSDISLAPPAARINRLKAVERLYELSLKGPRSHVDLMGVFSCSLNLFARWVFQAGARGRGLTLGLTGRSSAAPGPGQRERTRRTNLLSK